MTAVPNDLGNLRTLPQVLGQQLPGNPSELRTTLRMDATDPGTGAGVVVLGTSNAFVGLACRPDGTFVEARTFCADEGESVRFSTPIPDGTSVELRIRSNGSCGFGFGARAGDHWATRFDGFTAVPEHWVSAELGLFATAPVGSSGRGAAVFRPVSVMPG